MPGQAQNASFFPSRHFAAQEDRFPEEALSAPEKEESEGGHNTH